MQSCLTFINGPQFYNIAIKYALSLFCFLTSGEVEVYYEEVLNPLNNFVRDYVPQLYFEIETTIQHTENF